jgi:hypothetical protein
VGAYAVPVEFKDGYVLTAAQLNESFAAIEQCLVALEAKPESPKITPWVPEVLTLHDSAGGEISGHVTTSKSRRVGDSLEVVVATRFPDAPPETTG